MKLHVGCGSVKIPGYVNVDIRYLPNVDVVDNARYLRKFQHEQITEIYACHVLEHFCRWETSNVLRNWFELLQPEGVLYLSVPDFRSIFNYYGRTGDIKSIIGLLYGGQDYDENFHHICWDYQSLDKELKGVGFLDVVRYDWKIGPFNGFDDYSKCYIPHMDREGGELMSLNVRAVKGIS